MNSPTKLENSSSQILSLVEALTTAKREIDSQSDRVKQLELLLRRERRARESAEERARLMETHLPSNEMVEEETTEEGSSVPAFDLSQKDTTHSLIDGDISLNNPIIISNNAAASANSLKVLADHQDEIHRHTESIDASTSKLQERLEAMMREMDEMKMTMESYKQRAESAEHERKSLAEMIEQIRAKESHKRTILSGAPTPAESIDGSPGKTKNNKPRIQSEHGESSLSEADLFLSPTTEISSSSPHRPRSSSGRSSSRSSSSSSSISAHESNEDLKALQQTLTTALQAHERSQRWVGENGEVMMQSSAPFVSMVGVVLIGVGLMAWLNGWQRGER